MPDTLPPHPDEGAEPLTSKQQAELDQLDTEFGDIGLHDMTGDDPTKAEEDLLNRATGAIDPLQIRADESHQNMILNPLDRQLEELPTGLGDNLVGSHLEAHPDATETELEALRNAANELHPGNSSDIGQRHEDKAIIEGIVKKTVETDADPDQARLLAAREYFAAPVVDDATMAAQRAALADEVEHGVQPDEIMLHMIHQRLDEYISKNHPETNMGTPIHIGDIGDFGVYYRAIQGFYRELGLKDPLPRLQKERERSVLGIRLPDRGYMTQVQDTVEYKDKEVTLYFRVESTKRKNPYCALVWSVSDQNANASQRTVR